MLFPLSDIVFHLLSYDTHTRAFLRFPFFLSFFFFVSSIKRSFEVGLVKLEWAEFE